MNFKNLIKIKRVINDAIPYVVYNNILEKFSKSDDRKFYIYFDNF